NPSGFGGWVWYAQDGLARLYNGADRFLVDGGGNLFAQGNLFLGSNYISFANGGTSGPFIAADPTHFYYRLRSGHGTFSFQGYSGWPRVQISPGFVGVNGAPFNFGAALAVYRAPTANSVWWDIGTASLQDGRAAAAGVGGQLIFEGRWNTAGAYTPYAGV